jgi:GxxExxY protein
MAEENTETVELLHRELTYQIIGAFREVYNGLGWGFLESVYHRAMEVVLTRRGIPYVPERVLPVHFEGHLLGHFRADFVVDGRVVVELKAADRFHPAHEAQLLNYLRASGLQVGLLLNFGPTPQHRRMIWTRHRRN